MVDEIPAEVRTLLRDHIVSVDQLQVLLMLRGRPQELWTIQTISNALHIEPDLVWSALDGLRTSRLVNEEREQTEPMFRYAPDTALEQAVDDLARSFETRRAAVMSIMSVNAIERVRSGAIRAFSDSFLISKRNRDG